MCIRDRHGDARQETFAVVCRRRRVPQRLSAGYPEPFACARRGERLERRAIEVGTPGKVGEAGEWASLACGNDSVSGTGIDAPHLGEPEPYGELAVAAVRCRVIRRV